MVSHDSANPPSSQTAPPGLYLVATPIGNLRDITLRALDILKLADVILCEDTRVSKKLMSHYGITAPLLSYHDHNGDEMRPKVMRMLGENKRVALVSDAGTPLISDPGYKLARDARDQGHYVTALPGASSVMAALCLCGLPTDRFYFAGFLPARQQALEAELKRLAAIDATLVIFESARRLEETCAAMLAAFGDREASVVREISKMFEETRKARLSELLTHYREQGEPKGEAVVVIAPPEEAGDVFDLPSLLATLMQTHSLKEAAAIAAEQAGCSRKEAYAAALALKN